MYPTIRSKAHIIKQARETNDYKSGWCANRVIETCHTFEMENNREPIVACMGLAFKPDIDDLAKYITSRILSEARAEVLIVEPNIDKHKTFSLVNYENAYRQADIIVWPVRHKEFVALARNNRREKIELDFCGVRK